MPQLKQEFANDISGWLCQDRVALGEINVLCIEALHALRAVCQVFLRNRSRRCIEQSESEWAELAHSLTEQSERTQSVEHLPLHDRALLINAGLKIIRGWPATFISFANKAEISKTHFNGAECLQPSWMTDLIDSKLTKQNRSVTGKVLIEAVTVLTEQLARTPTKTELRRYLAWQGDKGLEAIFFSRTLATSHEWHQFLDAIGATDLQLSSTARSHRAFVCDVAVLLLCLMRGEQIDSYANVRRRSLCGLLTSCRAKFQQINKELCQLVINFERTSSRYPFDQDKRCFVSTRQVKKRLGRLMFDLPDELVRDIEVFRFFGAPVVPVQQMCDEQN